MDNIFLDYGQGDSSGNETSFSPIWIGVIQIACCAFGMVGNLVVIFVIISLREFKKAVTNWYMLQLAIADLIFLCTIPIKLKEHYDEKWTWGVAYCKFNESLLFLNYYSSILFLVVMTVDRYLIVCHNASRISQKFRKLNSAYRVTVAIWVISVILCTPIFKYSDVTNCKCQYQFVTYQTPEEECIAKGAGFNMKLCVKMIEYARENPNNCGDDEIDRDRMFGEGGLDLNMYGSEDYDYNDTYSESSGAINSGGFPIDNVEVNYETESEPVLLAHECSYMSESTTWHAFLCFNFIGLFIIPFIIMCTCYAYIVRAMIKSVSRAGQLKVNSKTEDKPISEKTKLSSSEKMYRRTIKLCVAYVVFFAICWLPYHTVHMAKLASFCNVISSVAFILVILNSVLNPCLYNIVGKKFSKRMRNALKSVQGNIVSHSENSFSSGLNVRYWRERKANNSNLTATTRIYKGKSVVESSDRSSGDGYA